MGLCRVLAFGRARQVTKEGWVAARRAARTAACDAEKKS